MARSNIGFGKRNGESPAKPVDKYRTGWSKREQIALAALECILMGEPETEDGHWPGEVARQAVRYADALLDELAQPAEIR